MVLVGRLPSAAPPVVGFCFSFPVEQTALDAGTVARLTKRFENEGLVDSDPVQMLSAALKRANFPACAHHACIRVRAHPDPDPDPDDSDRSGQFADAGCLSYRDQQMASTNNPRSPDFS